MVDTCLVSGAGWDWDPSLYAGSAAYYAEGRVPYPGELADALTLELGFDGRGRLLDVGCGPGSLTLLLAPRFEQVIGLDADPQMLAEGQRRADAEEVANVGWVHRRAEDLSPDLGLFQVRALLVAVSPDNVFSEQMREIAVDIWRVERSVIGDRRLDGGPTRRPR